MKQFQKYGVAAAVASVAAAANAQVLTNENLGDMAIVPYYTTVNGQNTGVHIVNTTDSTQVVKVRLRRGADSKDALDFNVIMSPEDEWTASVRAGGDTGVQMITDDNTCTAPAFTDGVAQMPGVFATGAQEGYIEIIAMAQTIDEDQPIAEAALHDSDGMPDDCDAVRDNFYRVTDTEAASSAAIGTRGIHNSERSSNGSLTANATGAFTANISDYTDSDDRALKVSYFIRDSDGGLEVGGNAVMMEGFASAAMMTNQQPIRFNEDDELVFDAYNFELPNLAFGSLAHTGAGTRTANHTGLAGGVSGAATLPEDRQLWAGVRGALGTDAVINEWSDKDTGSATVNTDWVVTLPGQYVMEDAICSIYANYTQADGACANASGVSGAAGIDIDDNELPLFLVERGTSQIAIYDREEQPLAGTPEAPDDDLAFSPSDQGTAPLETDRLLREVNVLVWSQDLDSTGVLGSLEEQQGDSGLGLRRVISAPGGEDTAGWAELTINPEPTTANLFHLGVSSGAAVFENGEAVEAATSLADQRTYADLVDVSGSKTPVVGMAVWQRNFGSNAAANYGRAIEHSTVNSTR